MQDGFVSFTDIIRSKRLKTLMTPIKSKRELALDAAYKDADADSDGVINIQEVQSAISKLLDNANRTSDTSLAQTVKDQIDSYAADKQLSKDDFINLVQTIESIANIKNITKKVNADRPAETDTSTTTPKQRLGFSSLLSMLQQEISHASEFSAKFSRKRRVAKSTNLRTISAYCSFPF
jgi:hypothetical protein